MAAEPSMSARPRIGVRAKMEKGRARMAKAKMVRAKARRARAKHPHNHLPEALAASSKARARRRPLMILMMSKHCYYLFFVYLNCIVFCATLYVDDSAQGPSGTIHGLVSACCDKHQRFR